MDTPSLISFQVTYRGAIHPLSLLPESTLAMLQIRLEELTSVPPSQQKLIYKGKKPSHTDDTTLQEAGFKNGIRVQLLGATAEEVGGIRKIEDEQRKRERIMRERALKGTVKVRSTGLSTFSPLPTQYRFHKLEPLPHLPKPETALSFLERISSDPAVLHVMQAHRFSVGMLTELAPHEQPNLLGLNMNAGQVIKLRIRTDVYDGFRPYLDVRRVLCHELSHNVWGDHDNNFKELNSRLNREVVEFERAAREGAHLLVDGLGGYQPTSELEAEARVYVLGGDGVTGPSANESIEERRRRMLEATMNRLRKEEEELEQSCGTRGTTGKIIDDDIPGIDDMADTKTAPTNPMRELRIEKLVITHPSPPAFPCLADISVGESGDRLTRASKVLEQLTGQTPVTSKARYTVRTFGIRRNEKIAVHVTIRGPKAEEILERGLKVKEYELRRRNFSETGNFGFGIQEHIDLGARYDPGIGIFGMDFYVVMGRPGNRVAKRRVKTARVGPSHRVGKDDTMAWFKQRFDGIILVSFLT
ncbi:hypothetical protein EW146_g3366 [Bondarzewia mesenterica]|uniref:WLM domain-containing protein n=1 Tax=Bondarzewia mesenterica TaxID=1095465 RepID=A0A4S4LY77_9AGAM|nr:hypothetical protein EW146_g3366 [Bondarzewia mesenterica]